MAEKGIAFKAGYLIGIVVGALADLLVKVMARMLRTPDDEARGALVL